MQFSILAVATLLLSLSQATPLPAEIDDSTRLGNHNCYAAKSNGTPNPQIQSLPPAGGINPSAWCTSTCLLCNAEPDSEACSTLPKFCENF
ncbi:hypothetical protein TWF281_004116 [Arthrobotrys megalospora]